MTMTRIPIRRVAYRTAAAPALVALAVWVAACNTAPQRRVEIIDLPAPALSPSIVPNPPTSPAVVILPPGYRDTTRRYPVVYYLPGFVTGVTDYVDGSLGFRFDEALDDLVRSGATTEMVIVIANGRNGLGGSFYVNSPVTGRAEDHLLADVVPQIESRYRVARDRAGRGIAGNGMGGFGALNLAMRHPDVFGAVFAMNAALFDEGGFDEEMLSAPLVRAWSLQRERMRSWPRDEAGERLAAYTRELYSANGGFATFRGYVLAYAAAFAPNPDAGPPFADWPSRQDGGGVTFDPAVAERLRQGIGGWSEKAVMHRDGWVSLRGIGIDIGRDEGNAWILRGARHLGQALHDAGIDAELTEHDGGEGGRLGDRIGGVMLPFFSRVFGTGIEAGAAGAAPGQPQEPHHD
ncbi:MAG: alpha/beta hydrolase-fold protein [Acidobacteriota bacterium]